MNYFAIPGLTRSFNAVTDAEKIRKLLKSICKIFNVTPEQIKSKSRKRDFVEPRHCLCFMAAGLTNLSLKYIGLFVGYKDHSPVIHGRDTFENLCKTQITMRNSFKKVCRALHINYNKLLIGVSIVASKTIKFKILNLLRLHGSLTSRQIVDKLDDESSFHHISRLCQDEYIIKFGDPRIMGGPIYDLTVKGNHYLNRCT